MFETFKYLSSGVLGLQSFVPGGGKLALFSSTILLDGDNEVGVDDVLVPEIMFIILRILSF